MENLINLIGKQLTSEVVKKASGMIGESEGATQTAINAMLPTLVGAMAQQGTSKSGAEQLMNVITAQGDTSGMLSNLGGMFDGGEATNSMLDSGGTIVNMLLGDKMGGVLNMITSLSGMKKDSSSSLLKMLAPLAMGVIGKQIGGSGSGSGGGASALMNLLGGQGEFLKAAAPAGLAGALGMDSLDGLMSNMKMPDVNMPDVKMPKVSAPNVKVPEVKASGGLPGWLLPVVGLLVVAGLLWYLFGRGANVPAVPEVSVPDVSVPAIELGADITAAACDGIGTITNAISGVGEITADTEASGIAGMIGTVRGAFDSMKGMAGLAEMVGFSQVGDAITTVEGLLNGLDGVLGDKAAEINTAVGGITTATSGLTTGLSCQ